MFKSCVVIVTKRKAMSDVFNMKNVIGWIGNVAVFPADCGRWLVDMTSGKKMFVKGGEQG